jgi:DNA-binding PadR family transcriptional regulator
MIEVTEKETKTLQEYTPHEIELRIVKNFLDILILRNLSKYNSLSGYDIIELIHEKFKQLISPGTVYSVLYAIERKGLVKGESDGRKTVYTLTEKGKAAVEDISRSKKELALFMENFMA